MGVFLGETRGSIPRRVLRRLGPQALDLNQEFAPADVGFYHEERSRNGKPGADFLGDCRPASALAQVDLDHFRPARAAAGMMKLPEVREGLVNLGQQVACVE